MESVRTETTNGPRLRVRFAGAACSFSLHCGATLEDVARKLRTFSLRRFGRPMAIDVFLKRDLPASGVPSPVGKLTSIRRSTGIAPVRGSLRDNEAEVVAGHDDARRSSWSHLNVEERRDQLQRRHMAPRR